jgi:hypothetical protein
VTHAARIVLGLLYPRRLQKTYHAAGGGCRNRACQVRSWSSEEAGLDLENRWEIGPFAHTRASALGVSVGPSAVGRGWSPPLTKPVVTAVEQQATTEPHCSRGAQSGGIYVYVVQRGPTPGGPGSGLRPGRRRFQCQLPPWLYTKQEQRGSNTHRVRTTLSTLVAKYISRRRGRGCRNRACQVRS